VRLVGCFAHYLESAVIWSPQWSTVATATG
jgi:hypothetical protein